jgi:hypothetical protein
VAVGRAHHGNLDALIAQSSDTSSPFSFDRGPPFELEAELAKEINRLSEVIDDDSYVVHPFECHVSNLPNLQVSSSLTTDKLFNLPPAPHPGSPHQRRSSTCPALSRPASSSYVGALRPAWITPPSVLLHRRQQDTGSRCRLSR